MRELLERFRLEAGSRAGLRYSQELRGLGRQFAEHLLAEGGSRRQAASELGVSEATLARWLRGVEAAAGGELCEVVVASPRLAAAAGVVVISPSGWRVEGLGVREAAELLAALA
jgi:transposase